jgi:carbamoyl-phosphate synthase small subunit
MEHDATVLLADGLSYIGKSFGAPRHVSGEVVFCTGLSGYVETLTDPSYRGQILVLTYPLQGNYGVPQGPLESGRIQVQGLVVLKHCNTPSHHASLRSLGEWLRTEGIPAVEAVDTRAITKHLREYGTMRGTLNCAAVGSQPESPIDISKLVQGVIPVNESHYPGTTGLKILVVDTGCKENIVRCLVERGVEVWRMPYLAQWEDRLPQVDGLVLTNGPGDPRELSSLADRIRAALQLGVPTFGICLGHQLLALAAGAKTYKLKFGHRSHNQPVVESTTQRAFVTSQNHGYAVDTSSLPPDWEPWFTNLNDGTNEGIRHKFRPFRSVQFHPEASAGPQDTAYLFDEFLNMVSEVKATKR